MPSFGATHRTIVDPVAGEDSNAIRARVANSYPSRISPVFNNSNFLKQNTLVGRKIKDSLAHAAKTFDDVILMKSGIAHLQRDIISLERETEKSKRVPVPSASSSKLETTQQPLAVFGSAQRAATLHSLPIEDLRTALNLCSYVAADSNGNVVRVSALADLLLKSVNAWAGSQVENLMRVKSIYLNDGQVNNSHSASSITAKTVADVNQQLMLSMDPSFDAQTASTSRINHVLELSRLLGGNTPEATAALLRAVQDAEDFAEDQASADARQRWEKLHNVNNNNINNNNSVLSLASPQRNMKSVNNNNNNNNNSLVSSPTGNNNNFSISRRQQQHHQLIERSRLEQEKFVEIEDALINRDRQKLSALTDSSTQTTDDDELLPLAPVARSMIKGGARQPQANNNTSSSIDVPSSSPSSSPAGHRGAFAVSLSTRVALDEANIKIGELERKLLFYKSLESMVAESDLVGLVTRLCFKNEKLLDLGLDLPNLVISSSATPTQTSSLMTTPKKNSNNNKLLLSLEQQNLIRSTFANTVYDPNGHCNSENSIHNHAIHTSYDALSETANSPSSMNRTVSLGNNTNINNNTGSGTFVNSVNTSPQQQQQQQQQNSKKLTTKEHAALLEQQKRDAAANTVPLREYEQLLEEHRRVRALLAVQQATLNVVTNELEVSDAFRDWVAWKKSSENSRRNDTKGNEGDNSVESRLRSLKVDIPILTDQQLQELINDEEAFQLSLLQQQQQQNNNNNNCGIQHERSSVSDQNNNNNNNLMDENKSTTTTLLGVTPESPALNLTPTAKSQQLTVRKSSMIQLKKTMSATNVFAPDDHSKDDFNHTSTMDAFLGSAANNNNSNNNNNTLNSAAVANEIRQQVLAKTLELASNIALRRTFRENKSLHESLQKILYRIELLESRKNSL